ncbi:glycosyltransferase family 1 protein [Sulfurimonas sp.]|uniref:glycosyltransferase family 4 protein n=1 Tax=Sulfurimonas sp. TaxID=2022749 RepID=UPI0026349FAE|nr:glycosyltransferase family 1 protein [Sulfurimonas sp.]MCW8895346.1 glycosyltransferase family 4 protein [Sulfurimonas sp.]
MMKLLFDHQIFTLQKYGGISRYFYELIKEFNHMEGIEPSTSLIFSNNHYISSKNDVKHISFFPDSEFRGKQRFMNLFNKTNSVYQISKQSFDIFHPTYYDPYFLSYIGDKPFVLTVYDMIHERFNDTFSTEDKTSEQKRMLVEKASKIIAISQSTKRDLIELFGLEASKIEVVYLGNSMISNTNQNSNLKIPKKYILFVGSRGGYKNFDKFIKSISKLLNEDRELSIVCAGGGKFKTSENEMFITLDINHQVHQFDLDDSKLQLLYNNALMFVFPSLYEGFGIPILESFACECPLVCSNTSSLPEIAGDGAKYFDPNDEESIFSAVSEVLYNKNLRDDLVERGRKRLKHFSWKKTALETKKIYESILQ